MWQIGNAVNLSWYKVMKLFEHIRNICKKQSLGYILCSIAKILNTEKILKTQVRCRFNNIIDNMTSLNGLTCLNKFNHVQFGYFSVVDTLIAKWTLGEQNQLEDYKYIKFDSLYKFPIYGYILYLFDLARSIKLISYTNINVQIEKCLAYKLMACNKEQTYVQFVFKGWKQPFELLMNFMVYNKHSLPINYLMYFNNYYFLYSNFSEIKLKYNIVQRAAIIYLMPYKNLKLYGLLLASKSIMEETNFHINVNGHLVTNYPIFKFLKSGKSLLKLLKIIK